MTLWDPANSCTHQQLQHWLQMQQEVGPQAPRHHQDQPANEHPFVQATPAPPQAPLGHCLPWHSINHDYSTNMGGKRVYFGLANVRWTSRPMRTKALCIRGKGGCWLFAPTALHNAHSPHAKFVFAVNMSEDKCFPIIASLQALRPPLDAHSAKHFCRSPRRCASQAMECAASARPIAAALARASSRAW